MIIDNLIRLLLVSVSYIVLIFGLAFIMLNKIIKVRTFFNKILLYFIIGNFYVMNVVFLLLFFKCTSRIITITTLVFGAIFIRYLLDKYSFKNVVFQGITVFALLSRGIYGWKFFRNERLTSFWKKIKNRAIVHLKYHSLEIVIFFICLGISIYYMGYRFVHYSGFGMYDEFVHLAWVQNMLQGQIFSDGVYPFGMHNILYAIIKVFGFDAFTVTRYFGFIIVVHMLIMLYILLKKICRVRYAPLIGIYLYVAFNMFSHTTWDRLQYTLPEEFGMIFLYPVCIYLYYFLRDHQRQDLVLFGISFTLTLYIHYYVTIIAFILCLSVGFSRIVRMFKEKLFTSIIICGLISVLVGILPIGIGIARGDGLQGSLYWAMGVITNSSEQDADDESIDEESINEEVEIEDQEKDTRNSMIEIVQKMKKNTISTVMNEEIFWILIACMTLVTVNTVLRNLFRKTNPETFFQFSIVLYISALLILLDSNLFGLPVIIENYRISVFIGYVVPVLLCMPFELIAVLYEKERWSKIAFDMIIVGFIGLIAWTVYYYDDYKKEFSEFRLLQTNSSVKVYYDILEDYEKDSWTIVSTVDEYSIVLDSGYHYEWIDLLAELENYTESTSITIPTEYIFFFIEKRPIIYGDLVTIGNSVKKYDRFTTLDARTVISDQFQKQPSQYYVYERPAIMAKGYYWAEKYKYHFPNEMTVFYEDDDFICYQLKQEPYYLNNLAINYGYNVHLDE